MGIKIKNMWSWIINYIPNAQLEVYAWRFGLSAILLSLAGGLCGWIVLDIRNKVSELRSISEADRTERIKNAEQSLASAQAELVEIKEKQDPRIITNEKRAAFMFYIEKLSRGRVAIATNNPDNETLLFIKQIQSILEESKYDLRKDVIMMPGTSMTTNARQSLSLVVNDIKELEPSYVGSLQGALNYIGFSCGGVANPSIAPKKGEAVIFITNRNY